MKKFLLSLPVIFIAICFAFGQGQYGLFMANNAVMNINNGSMLVVNQISPLGITTQGTNNAIIHSEHERNRISWVVRNGTGNYVFPFGISTTDRIPLTYQITTAGSNNGALTVSTYPTASNNTPYPSVYASAVTHMNSSPPTTDKSLFVSDRFWILRDLNMPWTTKPIAVLTFPYRDSENAAPNTIIESNLVAQYWNGNWNPDWSTGITLGTVNTINNTVSGVNSNNAGNIFTWIVADRTNLLPIELLYFSVRCVEKDMIIEWASASETNNAYYTIQQSENGIDWETIAYITGANNSNEVLYYTYIVSNSYDKTYYFKLSQTDYDGTTTLLGIKSANCSAFGSGDISDSFMNLYADFENNIYVTYYSSGDQTDVLSIFDINGKLIGKWHLNSTEGVNYFQIPVIPVRQAVYVALLQQSNKATLKKIMLK